MAAWPRHAYAPTNESQGSVYTTGCCGLGHRTSRLMKMFAYAAERKKRLYVSWGACVGTNVTNIFNEFFEDGELLKGYRGEDKSSMEIFLNEPPALWKAPAHQKEWNLETEQIAPYAERFAEDLVASLRPSWVRLVRDFVENEFDGRATVGVHFRFGNGEKFGRKPANKTDVVLTAARAVRAVGGERVFVATDDEDAVDILRKCTSLDVVTREQWRPPKGSGVFFSSWRNKDTEVADVQAKAKAHGEMVSDGQSCIRRSADMLIDAILLGYTDLQIFTVASTFTVLPRLMAYARGNKPTCLFLHTNWRALSTKAKDLTRQELTCSSRERHQADRHPIPLNDLVDHHDGIRVRRRHKVNQFIVHV